jgi:MFS family permease
VSFLLMCWRVKEGEYAPPPPNVKHRKGVFAAAQTYFRECFSHRFYLCYFLFTGLWMLGATCIQFQVFFAQSLGMSLGQFGKLQSYLMIPSMVLIYPAASLADRLHPLRILLIGGCTMPVLYFLVFILAHSIPVYVTLMAIIVPINAFYGACLGPTSMLLWPKERYGQFGSANAMFYASFGIVGSLGAGLFLDLLASRLPLGDNDYYRYIFLWISVFQMLAMVFLWQVYRGWQRHGGRSGYVPPSVSGEISVDQGAPATVVDT